MICIFSFTVNSYSSTIRTVYQLNEPIEILTKQGMQTILVFQSEIEFASVGNTTFFNVSNEQKNDKLIISPQQVGVKTNCIVMTKAGNEYVFELLEDKDDRYYSLVNVKANVNLDDKQKAKVLKGDILNFDKNILELFTVYNTDDYLMKSDKFNFNVKKGTTIKNINETVIWLRIRNTFERQLSITTLGLKDRKLISVYTENYNQYINSGDYADFFLITKGQEIGEDLILKIKYMGQTQEIKLSNIPFNEREYQMYNIDN